MFFILRVVPVPVHPVCLFVRIVTDRESVPHYSYEKNLAIVLLRELSLQDNHLTELGHALRCISTRPPDLQRGSLQGRETLGHLLLFIVEDQSGRLLIPLPDSELRPEGRGMEYIFLDLKNFTKSILS